MRFTIKTKLAVSFAFLSVLSAVMAGIAIYNLSSLNRQISEIIAGPVKQLQILSDLRNSVNIISRSEKNAAMATDPQTVAENKKRAEDSSAKVKDAFAPLASVSEGEAKALIPSMQKIFDEFLVSDQEVLRLATINTSESNAQAAALSMGEGRKKVTALFDIVDRINGLADEGMHRADEETNQQYETSRNILTASIVML